MGGKFKNKVQKLQTTRNKQLESAKEKKIKAIWTTRETRKWDLKGLFGTETTVKAVGLNGLEWNFWPTNLLYQI